MQNSFKRYDKKSAYDLVKRTKANNFTFLNQNFCKPNQTVLFGDSITEIFNHYELFYRYTEETGQAVYNRGISGDTSNRLLERLSDNVLNLQPKNIVILIGTNDIGLHCVSPEHIAHNIQCLVQAIKENNAKTNIILEAVYPVHKFLNTASVAMVGKRTNKEIALLNTLLKDIAQHEEITYLDLTDALSDRRGNLSKDYTFDGLHLNANGFGVVAEHVIPLLEK